MNTENTQNEAEAGQNTSKVSSISEEEDNDSDFVDQYGNDGAVIDGDYAFDHNAYIHLISKFRSPLKEASEFERFQSFLKSFELSDKETLLRIFEHFDEEEKKKIVDLTRVRMVEIKPGVVIPRKILKIRRNIPN